MSRRVPVYPSRLVGRRSWLERVADLHTRLPLVTLIGPGGVGKTRLAAEVARRRSATAVFVDLSTATTLASAALCLLRDVGADTSGADGDPIGRAARALAGLGERVVLLDNLEQVADVAVLLERLVREAPSVQFLATSREATGGPEAVVELPPLPVDDPEEGVQLFLSALPRLGPTAVDPVADRPRLGEIVRRLEGFPLAIELAAGRAAVLSLELIEQRLDQPLALLRDPSRPASRTTRMELSVEWSWELLEPATREALARLCAFAGPTTLTLASAVVGEDVEDHLQVLVARHLVRTDGDGRFSPYEVVRAFARRWADQEGLTTELWRRHAASITEVAAGLRRRPGTLPELRRLAPELEAVVVRATGLAHTDLGGWTRLAHLAVDALWPVWAGFLSEESLLGAFGTALALPHAGPEVLPLQAGLAVALMRRRDPAAWGAYARLAELAERHGDRGCLGLALLQQALLLATRGELSASSRLRERACVAFEGTDRGMALQARSGHAATSVRLALGQFAEAERELDACLAEAPAVGPALVGTLRRQRARVALQQGRFEEALALLDVGPRPTDVRLRAEEEDQLRSWAELGRGAERAAVEGCWADRPVSVVAAQHRSVQAALLAVIEGTADAAAGCRALAAELSSSDWHREVALWRVVLLAAAGDAPTEVPANADDPAGRSLVSLASAVAAGEAEPELETPSEHAFALRRVARARREQRLVAARTWAVASDGAWFQAPQVAEPVHLATRASLCRLAAALADDAARGGTGLDVEAMFAAGWPGERARPDAAANRVRVAVTTLRKLGLDVLSWERGRGWFLAAAVRVVA